eukprot:scaffold2043_cov63-Phaeocystis_antarctica.AAC.2
MLGVGDHWDEERVGRAFKILRYACPSPVLSTLIPLCFLTLVLYKPFTTHSPIINGPPKVWRRRLLALALGRLERLEGFAAADAVRNAHVCAGNRVPAGDIGNLSPQDKAIEVDALASVIGLAVLHAELRDDRGHELGLHVLEAAPLHSAPTGARGLGEIGR